MSRFLLNLQSADHRAGRSSHLTIDTLHDGNELIFVHDLTPFPSSSPRAPVESCSVDSFYETEHGGGKITLVDNFAVRDEKIHWDTDTEGGLGRLDQTPQPDSSP